MHQILRPDDSFDLADWPDDSDWDSPPCGEHCQCPLCQQADADERRLLAELDAAGDMIDLGQLGIVCKRPWVDGEAA